MSNTADSGRRIYPARGDPIRIVPLHHAEDAAQPAADGVGAVRAPLPQLTYRGGPLLTAVEVFTFFWGAAWEQAQSSTVVQINQFFDFILTSPLINQLTEYSVPGKEIGHGRRLGTITITAPAPHPSVSDTAIRHLLQQEISTNMTIPAPTANTLYFVYLPPGVRVVTHSGRWSSLKQPPNESKPATRRGHYVPSRPAARE